MLSKIFGKDKQEEEVAKPLPSPLNFRIGAMIMVDTLDLELFFGDNTFMDVSKIGKNRIESYTKVDLGDTFMHRFNFKGGFFEIMGNEDGSEFDEESITCYQDYDEIVLLPDDVDDWIGDEGIVGSHVFTLSDEENGDTDFHRVLFDNSEENISLNVDIEEYQDEKTSRTTSVDTMLFGRDIESGDNVEAEFLIAEVENSDQKSLAKIYIGVNISPSLIEVV